jgi:hypothetical protein
MMTGYDVGKSERMFGRGGSVRLFWIGILALWGSGCGSVEGKGAADTGTLFEADTAEDSADGLGPDGSTDDSDADGLGPDGSTDDSDVDGSTDDSDVDGSTDDSDTGASDTGSASDADDTGAMSDTGEASPGAGGDTTPGTDDELDTGSTSSDTEDESTDTSDEEDSLTGSDCVDEYDEAGRYDCAGLCFSEWYYESWLGDGYCDDETAVSGLHLYCDEYDWDGGDCEGGSEPDSGSDSDDESPPVDGEIGEACVTAEGDEGYFDCEMQCLSLSFYGDWIGDGYCDDGEYGAYLFCDEFDWDEGDCGDAPSDSDDGTADVDADVGLGEDGIGGDCETDEGSDGFYDCEMQCVEDWYHADWIGDGYCDDGTWGVYFECEEFDMDGGDCEEPPDVGLGEEGIGGDCETDEGSDGFYDCEMLCVEDWLHASWIGDGYCDDGTWGAYLECEEFDMDAGDCDAESSSE